MASRDTSWSVGPTLLWFCAYMTLGIWYFDGSLDAIAERLTHERDVDAQPAGPVFTAKPVVVADARDEVDEPEGAVPAVGSADSDRTKGSALEDVCIEGPESACTRWAMDAFYKAVREEGANKLGRAVRVSWYGDSVIATDAIPARLRSRLQGELGDGGPGYVYVVEPHRFCFHEGVARAHQGEWTTAAVSTQQTPDGLYGAGGASAEAIGGASATYKLNAGKASRVELYYLVQPRGGTATVKANGAKVLETATAGDKKIAGGNASATIEGGAQRFAIETRGKVRLFGIGLENDSGAVVDNLGIVSVNVRNFAHKNEENFATELVHRNADLLMIMIGANEAQWLGANDSATKAYQGKFEKVLAQLRKARPDATCLVVSPTDQAEATDAGYVSRPVMPMLIEAQRRAARSSGCAFFSTYDWMGGKGSAAKWFKRGLVGSDFQHLSRKGANKFADAVFDALMAGYKRYGH